MTFTERNFLFGNAKLAKRLALAKRWPISQAKFNALCRQAAAATKPTICPPCTELPQPKAGNRAGFKAARQARAMMR